MSTKSKQLIHKRKLKIQRDVGMYFSTAQQKRIPNSCLYGFKAAQITFLLMSIQRSVIQNNKAVSCPSLETMAQSFDTTVRHVNRIVDKLVEAGCLHFKNYFIIDQLTGEVKSDNVKIAGRIVLKKRTNGKLRLIINPLKAAKAYLEAKGKEKINLSRQYGTEIFKRYVNRYIDRQKWKPDEDHVSESPGGSGVINDTFDWSVVTVKK